MSSSGRSLREIFTKRQTTKIKPVAVKFKPAAVEKHSDSAVTVTAAEGETNHQKFVTNFKKSCERQHFRDNKARYNHAVSRLASAKKLTMVEEILEHQKKYRDIRSEGFVARLISLYGHAGMFEHARKLFDEMPQLKCPRGIMSFNSLLKAGLLSNNFDAVVEAYKDLPGKASLKPNSISYNILIHAYCKKGDFDGAIATLCELKKSGNKPDLFTFNTLLNALYGSGRFSEGEVVFASMKTESLCPDVVSYNAKLRGVFAKKDIEVTPNEVVAEMESRGIKPNLFTYNALITGYCGRGDLKEAMNWYGELQRSEIAPNVPTYIVLIQACCDNGDYSSACEVCLQAIMGRFFLKAAKLKKVVDGLVAEGKADEAEKLVVQVNSADYLNYKLDPPTI